MPVAIKKKSIRKIVVPTEEDRDYQVLMSRKKEKVIKEKDFNSWFKKRFGI